MCAPVCVYISVCGVHVPVCVYVKTIVCVCVCVCVYVDLFVDSFVIVPIMSSIKFMEDFTEESHDSISGLSLRMLYPVNRVHIVSSD